MKKTIYVLLTLLLLPTTLVCAQEVDPAFAQADADNNGVLSKEEFATYVTINAVTLPPALVQSLSDAADALAKDDFATYKKHLPSILTSVKQTTGAVRAALLPLSERLSTGKDLKSARRTFEPFSNTAANFVLAQPAKKRQAKIFQCPMSPVLGVGRWIQKDNPNLLNPFFGSEMLRCGSEVK
ncbi:MAG: hypothetical protein LBQ66_07210 [Planctomycetaceae bacterium]|nr:hypothetical protein [Planctomycetaceae bacterium]